jgi:DNA polymerase
VALTHGEPTLLAIATDADMVRLHGMVKAIRRDAHKMHALSASAMIETEAGEHYVAWFEPEHHILEAKPGSSCAASPSCAGPS